MSSSDALVLKGRDTIAQGIALGAGERDRKP